MLNLLRGLKKNSDKENFEEFCKIYLENVRKDRENINKTCLFNAKYFMRRNFRLIVLEQNPNSNLVQFDSQHPSNLAKEIPVPNNGNTSFNVNINKNWFDIIFGGDAGIMVNEYPYKSKVHLQDNQIIFTMVYPSYSQILKRIRSQSHSPSLSRSSSLGDYASINSAILNDMNATQTTQTQRKVAICIAWSCCLEDEGHIKLLFRFIFNFLQFFSIMAEKIAHIHIEHKSFPPDNMIKVRNTFADSLRAFYTAPRLALPVWDSLKLLKAHPWFTNSGRNLNLMIHTFMEKIVLQLLTKYHNKEKDFVLAKLLTAVLTYHQGWIHYFNPSVHKKHNRQFSCNFPYYQCYEPRQNPLCSQLGSLLMGCGGISISRTIVIGTHHHLINSLLYFLTFWIRFSPLIIRQEDAPDISQITNDSRKTTTRRKSASCNDPTDSGIGSQEDMRRRKLHANSGERGSMGSGLASVGTAISIVPSIRSSASQGSSPVKELTDQGKGFISPQQICEVTQMAVDYVNCSNRSVDFHGQLMPDKRSISGSIYVKEIPMVYGGKLKAEEDIMYRSLGHFAIGATTEQIIPSMVLQGLLSDSIPNHSDLTNELRGWLRHTFWLFQTPKRCELDLGETFLTTESIVYERPQSATAILMNSDKASVSLFTVPSDSRSDAIIRDLESPSPLIISMLDQLHNLLSSGLDGSTGSNQVDVVLQFIESQLRHIHRISLSLAHAVREMRLSANSLFDTFSIDRNALARTLSCHVDDLRLLYSTALSHSPDIYFPDSALFY